MGRITNLLLQRKRELEALIDSLESINDRIPGMRLRVSNIDGKPRYYCMPDRRSGAEQNIEKGSANKNAQYISKENIELAKALAQQDYDEKMLKTAKHQLKMIVHMLKSFDEDRLTEIFVKMNPARKELVIPRVPDRDSFVQEWMNISYIPGSFEDSSVSFYTELGERVRSKSEKILADRYSSRHIPYHYEMPLILDDGVRQILLHPDFSVLNVRTCKVFYHEHFGKMGDLDYVRNMMHRIDLYEKNGIYPGEKLLMSFESDTEPLDLQMVDRLIDRYLL